MRESFPGSPAFALGLAKTLSLVDGLYVEWAMEHNDEQARVVFGGSVPHRFSGWEMTVRPRTDDLVVDLESAFENDDGVGSGVPMQPGLQTSRVPDEIVLRPRVRILIQEPQADLPIVDGELRLAQLDRPEIVDDDRSTVSHARANPAGEGLEQYAMRAFLIKKRMRPSRGSRPGR
jgi:hypothetical protein